jgi:hypothetical protein
MSTTVIAGSNATAALPAVYVWTPDVSTTGGTFVTIGSDATVTATTPGRLATSSAVTTMDTVFTPAVAVDEKVTDCRAV